MAEAGFTPRAVWLQMAWLLPEEACPGCSGCLHLSGPCAEKPEQVGATVTLASWQHLDSNDLACR